MYEHLYTLVRVGRVWSKIEVNDVSLADLYRKYDDIWLVLSHALWNENKVLNMMNYRTSFDHYAGTLQTWLDEIQGKTLVIAGGEDAMVKRLTIKSYDLWDVGFKVQYFNRGAHPDSAINSNQARDVLATKDGVDYMELYKNCLFHVNGFVHPADASDSGLCIMDANLNASKAGDNRLGVIDFSELGGFEYIPITEDSLVEHYNAEASRKVWVSTEKDISDKTLFLVLGGYLLDIGRSCTTAGDHLINLEFDGLDIVDMYRRSYKTLDFSTLLKDILVVYEQSPWLNLTVEELRNVYHSPEFINSPEFMIGLLLNPHSFIIAVNSDKVCLEKTRVMHTNIPGKYVAEEVPEGILKFSNLKLAEATITGNRDDIVISTSPEVDNLWNASTVFHSDKLKMADMSESTVELPKQASLWLYNYYILAGA
jgi:hypothetical protein